MADKERHNLLSGGSSSGGGRLERSRLVLGSSDADGPCEEDCCCREKKGLFEEQETSRCYACRRPGGRGIGCTVGKKRVGDTCRRSKVNTTIAVPLRLFTRDYKV